MLIGRPPDSPASSARRRVGLRCNEHDPALGVPNPDGEPDAHADGDPNPHAVADGHAEGHRQPDRDAATDSKPDSNTGADRIPIRLGLGVGQRVSIGQSNRDANPDGDP